MAESTKKKIESLENVDEIQAFDRLDSLPSELLKTQYKTYQYSTCLSLSIMLSLYIYNYIYGDKLSSLFLKLPITKILLRVPLPPSLHYIPPKTSTLCSRWTREPYVVTFEIETLLHLALELLINEVFDFPLIA